MPTTPGGLPFPSSSDQANVPSDLQALATAVETRLNARVQNALVDAKGDLITATADNTPARLAVGANDTILTADSSTATGLKWAAAGMSLIATQTFNSSTTYSIPAGARVILVEIVGAGGGGGGGGTGSGNGGAGGGAGPGYSTLLDAATLGASVTVTVGAGGTGGAAGSDGNAGGACRFGPVAIPGGRRGGISTGLQGNGWNGPNALGTRADGLGTGGDVAAVGAGSPGLRGTGLISGGGGGGGSVSGGGTPQAGAAGGLYSNDPADVFGGGTTSIVSILTGGGGAAGTTPGGNGGNGTSRSGGGGGAGTTSGTGGVGGSGASPGGGGGGGGRGATAGGAGGAGGSGEVKVWVYG